MNRFRVTVSSMINPMIVLTNDTIGQIENSVGLFRPNDEFTVEALTDEMLLADLGLATEVAEIQAVYDKALADSYSGDEDYWDQQPEGRG